jgi:hypothetical protein
VHAVGRSVILFATPRASLMAMLRPSSNPTPGRRASRVENNAVQRKFQLFDRIRIKFQRCRSKGSERGPRVLVLVQVGVVLQAAATANSACAVRAEAVGRMARSGAVGASRWALNE